jgi:hypothetical protein
MAIMLLAEQGTPSYEDRLPAYCPQFPSWDAEISLRHFLHHSSVCRNTFHSFSPALPPAGMKHTVGYDASRLRVTSLGIGKGGFGLPAIIFLAIHRHLAGPGRLEDAAIGGGAVLTAASHQKERRDRKAAPFLFPTKPWKLTPPFPSGAGTWRRALPDPSRS